VFLSEVLVTNLVHHYRFGLLGPACFILFSLNALEKKKLNRGIDHPVSFHSLHNFFF
jgi:hypothetical protein